MITEFDMILEKRNSKKIVRLEFWTQILNLNFEEKNGCRGACVAYYGCERGVGKFRLSIRIFQRYTQGQIGGNPFAALVDVCRAIGHSSGLTHAYMSRPKSTCLGYSLSGFVNIPEPSMALFFSFGVLFYFHFKFKIFRFIFSFFY